MGNETVRHRMTPAPVTVALDTTVEEAYGVLRRHRFHHLPVMGPAGLEGIVSERDMLRVVSPFVDTASERDRDRYTLRRPVHQVMARKLVTIAPDDSVTEAARRMIDTRVGCLPVVGAKGLEGMLTRADLLAALVTVLDDPDGSR